MEPLKNMFGEASLKDIADALQAAWKPFDRKRFLSGCLRNLEPLSLNERMRRVTEVMHECLPATYDEALEIMSGAIIRLKPGYTNLVFPDYVGQYGLDHFGSSMKALAHFTKYGSSEFAIREFLRKDFDRTLQVMYTWASDKNFHVRRLASEGSRPRLPWSFKLDRVISEPRLTRPILEALKKDDEIYVRKSVANHLNDISKFDPAYLMKLFRSWDQSDPRTAWIVRHASRSLIKKGEAASLQLLGFEKDPAVDLKEFRLSKKTIRIGDSLEFSCNLTSKKKRPQKLALDYVIHYCRQRGSGRKVFKLKEFVIAPLAAVVVSRKHSFADRSTRKHFPGPHAIELQLNGKIVSRAEFGVAD